MRIFRWVIIFFVALLTLYTASGFFIVPYLVRQLSADAAFEATGQTLTIDQIDINPFTLELDLKEVILSTPDGAPHVTIDQVAVATDLRGLLSDEITLEQLELVGARFYSGVAEDGSLQLLDILTPQKTEASSDGAAQQTNLKVRQLRVDDVVFIIEDGSVDSDAARASLGPLSLSIEDFVTKASASSNLSNLSVDVGGGHIMLSGGFVASPFGLDIGFDIKEIELSHLHRLALLVKQKVDGISEISGILNGKGDIKIDTNLEAQFDGDLTNLVIEEIREGRQFLVLDRLGVKGVTFQQSLDNKASADTNQIGVAEVFLQNPKIDLVRLPDGSFLLPVGNQASVDPIEQSGLVPIKIELGGVAIKEGSVSIEDRSLKSVDSAQTINVVAINGNLGAIRYPVNPEDKPTSFVIEARVDGESAVKAEGQSRLGAPYQMAAELVLDRLSHAVIVPYTQEHLGRSVDAGELFLDLKYSILETEIKGQNTVLFNDWRWGNKVKSAEAVDAPLDLAFSLLEDKDGRVNLNIPVNGDLTDPSFEIGPIIQKATGNLITGLVSSPFRLLGSLIPGGGDDIDLSNVSFPTGEVDIPALEKAKLSTLAVSLKERPRLKLAIEGRAYRDISSLIEASDEEQTGAVENVVETTEVVLSPVERAGMRAERIKAFLVEAGIGEGRLILLPISIDHRTAKAQIKTDLSLVNS